DSLGRKVGDGVDAVYGVRDLQVTQGHVAHVAHGEGEHHVEGAVVVHAHGGALGQADQRRFLEENRGGLLLVGYVVAIRVGVEAIGGTVGHGPLAGAGAQHFGLVLVFAHVGGGHAHAQLHRGASAHGQGVDSLEQLLVGAAVEGGGV